MLKYSATVTGSRLIWFPGRAEFAGSISVVGAPCDNRQSIRLVLQTLRAELIATQRADGYLGVPREHDRTGTLGTSGAYHGVLGLYTWYRTTGDKAR